MQSKIKPEFVPIYRVFDSLDEAWEYINSQLPITETNDLKSLLMCYQNSLVHALDKERNESNSTT